MAESKFKVGDRVKLHRYHRRGVIIGVVPVDVQHYQIEWDGEPILSVMAEPHLVLAKKEKKKKH